MKGFLWKFINSSDKYKYVSYCMNKEGTYKWAGSRFGATRGFETEREAALFVDKILINKKKKPVNILKKLQIKSIT